MREDAADLAVHFGEDREEFLFFGVVGYGREFGGIFVSGDESVVNVVGENFEVEWPVIIAADEFTRAVDVASGGGAFFDLGDFALPEFCTLFVQVAGPKEKAVAEALEGNQRFFKTVGGGMGRVVDIATAAHVPFAEMSGAVAGIPENLGSMDRSRVQEVRHPAFGIGLTAGEVRLDTPALLVLAGAESDPGGGADGRVDVEVGEATAFGGEAIDVRRGNEFIAEAAGVAVTHVVDKKDQDVGFGRGLSVPENNETLAGENEQEEAHDGGRGHRLHTGRQDAQRKARGSHIQLTYIHVGIG